jgi:hypothetical protein
MRTSIAKACIKLRLELLNADTSRKQLHFKLSNGQSREYFKLEWLQLAGCWCYHKLFLSREGHLEDYNFKP